MIGEINEKGVEFIMELEEKTGVEITEETGMSDLLEGIISGIFEEMEEEDDVLFAPESHDESNFDPAILPEVYNNPPCDNHSLYDGLSYDD